MQIFHRYAGLPLLAAASLAMLDTNAAALAPAGCADVDAALEYWRPIREDAGADTGNTDALALELLPCLGSTSPELRDRIGYELLTYWLRNDRLSKASRRELTSRLRAGLTDATPDASLRRSFSALILAEVMRADALGPFLDDGARQALLDDAIAALGRETDYRGLDPELGWVHPVAHVADLLWRFALHPATNDQQASAILDAVDHKLAPPGIFFTYNESDRLARAVSTLVRRNLVDTATIAAWLGSFEKPRSMEKWSDAFRTPAGMAELHDTKQFLRALSDQLADLELDPAIADPLKALVSGFTHLI